MERERSADTTLIEDALAGRRPSVERLVNRLTPVVQARVARCLLRSGAGRDVRRDVEDLSQDVFLYVFSEDGRALRAWREEGGLSLENYIGLITERRTISALRSGRRNPWREETAADETVEHAAHDPGPAELASAADLLDRLLARLRDTLSPLGFHLFELIYVRELSVEEVCAETELSPEAVYAWRSRLRRAARQLHDALLSETDATARTPSGGVP